MAKTRVQGGGATCTVTVGSEQEEWSLSPDHPDRKDHSLSDIPTLCQQRALHLEHFLSCRERTEEYPLSPPAIPFFLSSSLHIGWMGAFMGHPLLTPVSPCSGKKHFPVAAVVEPLILSTDLSPELERQVNCKLLLYAHKISRPLNSKSTTAMVAPQHPHIRKKKHRVPC